jgi:hypothetical protein
MVWLSRRTILPASRHVNQQGLCLGKAWTKSRDLLDLPAKAA